MPRLRLVQRLERRFQVPVMVVAAPAGYGKTSALSLALHADDAGGVDLWVQCAPPDGDPRVFAEAVMQAGGMTYTGRTPRPSGSRACLPGLPRRRCVWCSMTCTGSPRTPRRGH